MSTLLDLTLIPSISKFQLQNQQIKNNWSSDGTMITYVGKNYCYGKHDSPECYGFFFFFNILWFIWFIYIAFWHQFSICLPHVFHVNYDWTGAYKVPIDAVHSFFFFLHVNDTMLMLRRYICYHFLQSLLCDPNPNSPANSEAARMFSENKREYNRRVREIVEQSWTAD